MVLILIMRITDAVVQKEIASCTHSSTFSLVILTYIFQLNRDEKNLFETVINLNSMLKIRKKF